MNVLILKSDYHGAYGSFDHFVGTTIKMFEAFGDKVYSSDNINQICKILENNKIDFTINFGHYCYFVAGIPLYDKYKVLNYQWIVDNPLRAPFCDNKPQSKYNKFVFIDSSFCKFVNCTNGYLHLPIPFECKTNSEEKARDIFAPIKLKSAKYYLEQMKKSIDWPMFKKFIDNYNLDDEFNDFFLSFLKNNNISDITFFFDNINGYIRLIKRIKAIQSIKSIQVIIPSNNPDGLRFESNIKFINPMSYEEALDYQKRCMFVLNCNPNYDYCLHDRVSYSISNGTIVISDKNKLLDQIKMPFLFEYKNLNIIDKYVNSKFEYNEVLEKQKASLNKYSLSRIYNSLKKNYLKFLINKL